MVQQENWRARLEIPTLYTFGHTRSLLLLSIRVLSNVPIQKKKKMSLRRSFLSLRSSSFSHFTSEHRLQPQQQEPSPPAEDDEGSGDRWSMMLPELLGEIIRRVETSEDRWPLRKNVVSCACVCRRWRQITTAMVGSPRDTGKITFPSSLKQVP